MPDLAPRPADLDPIERASAGELQSLQLERLQWTLRHAIRQRAALPRGLRRGRRPPGRLQGPGRPGQVPADQQVRPARELPVRHVRGAAGAGRAGARLVRHHRPRHRGRVHPPRPGRVGQRDGPLHPRRRRASRAHPAQRLRLRAVHRGARRALRRGETRLHGRPGLRRDDRAAGHPDPRLPPRHHHGHAVLHARDRGRDAAAGGTTRRRRRCGSASSAPNPGRTRCAARWKPGWASTPRTSTACPR